MYLILNDSLKIYTMPSVFQSGWSPQVMPQTNMSLQNSFQNDQLVSMQQGYPQQQVYPQN